MPTSQPVSDPSSMPPARWQSRLAALKSRGVDDSDHRLIECREALAYWRVRRTIDAESGALTESAADALAELLHAQAVSA